MLGLEDGNVVGAGVGLKVFDASTLFGAIGLPPFTPSTVTSMTEGSAFMASSAAVIAADVVLAAKVKRRMSEPQCPSQVATLRSEKVAPSCAVTASQIKSSSGSRIVPQSRSV